MMMVILIFVILFSFQFPVVLTIVDYYAMNEVDITLQHICCVDA